VEPTLEHIKKLLFETNYPGWLWNTMYVAAAATFLSIFASVLRGLCDRAPALLAARRRSAR
jgi:ABC-type glycerol-3-phosphate transport system permease component